MLTKNQIKLINSLSQKKSRNQHQLFVVEGIKGIDEFLNSSFELQHLYSTDEKFHADNGKYTIISQSDLKRISNLTSPNSALALFRIPSTPSIDISQLIVA